MNHAEKMVDNAVKYPHLVNIGLLRTLEERRHVIDWLAARELAARKRKMNASDDTYFAKACAWSKANAALENAKYGTNWMPHHARANKELGNRNSRDV